MILTSNVNDKSLEGNTGRVMNLHCHNRASDISGHLSDHWGGWSGVEDWGCELISGMSGTVKKALVLSGPESF